MPELPDASYFEDGAELISIFEISSAEIVFRYSINSLPIRY